jgi:tetratricopeptide (TPR) repeat protein
MPLQTSPLLDGSGVNKGSVFLSAVIVAGAILCWYTGYAAYKLNGGFGFPLDDPWIHLQFAKNLHDYGSFSYYKNEMVTSGSTSPLYTAILALGLFITSNEMILSYVLGVLFFLSGGYVLFRMMELDFDGGLVFAAGGTLLFLFEPRFQWIVLSGMETTLFIMLLLTVLYAYKKKQGILLGVSGGLLLWTRPEAVMFLGILAVDYLYHRFYVKRAVPRKKSDAVQAPDMKWMRSAALIVAVCALAYGAFNYALSGSIFPNTYAAKLKYYGLGSGSDFPLQVFHYFADGHMLAVAVLVLVAVARILSSIVQRSQQKHLVPLLFSAAMFFAFWQKLPFLYQQGRYMMPVLPFFLILGMYGLSFLVEFLGKWVRTLKDPKNALVASAVVVAVLVVQFGYAATKESGVYADYCRYISERQVRTAKWLNEHLPEDAVIGTHDIGAIAFYSKRRIADMVGLVSPEMINNIGDLTRLRQFLIDKKTTHLAVLRNWFEIVNQEPVFKTDEAQPEIMEVFEFRPEQTHFTTREASAAIEAGSYYFNQNNFQRAMQYLEHAVRLDPQSSKAHYALAVGYAGIGRLPEAEEHFRTAMRIFPEYWDAHAGLALMAARRSKPEDAIVQLEKILRENPRYANGYRAIAEVYRTFKIDTTKAGIYMQKYNELANEVTR